ncbi:threonine-phosphate decarboxylase CobD [Roseococcus pinisoli]|uniref:threonine-phosphate decarboxylase n=1 Tax=Roseococcus pinisoli TaxID=2835040 RepID=A0ABS5QJD7_9PROT|nr:threonine-phosphate decarboxylase CobD [Roseococcus pinisoli]MBS7813692.1 threonine-phosphate decarboxylase [Roseococcus pinisoli]
MSPDIPHGGNLTAARARFPEARSPWLDLSTGISPFPYPVPALPAEAFTRLPEPADLERLQALAARRYGARDPAQVVAAPGTQILLPLIAKLVPQGRARVLGPTYAEHARAAALAGHALAEEGAADLLTIVNPNNPDGRFRPRAELLAARPAQGLLVVDEAFMEAAPADESLAGAVDERLVVLRSFGKFHGLAGLRLGFAITAAPLARRLRDALGPWAVSGPALAVGLAALADEAWASAMRARLAAAAAALDGVLTAGGCRVLGGTSLFRLAEVPPGTFERLGRAGILVRGFDYWPDRLRFGLPPDAAGLERLAEALA